MKKPSAKVIPVKSEADLRERSRYDRNDDIVTLIVISKEFSVRRVGKLTRTK